MIQGPDPGADHGADGTGRMPRPGMKRNQASDQRTAIGRAGDPVAPTIRSGKVRNKNS